MKIKQKIIIWIITILALSCVTEKASTQIIKANGSIKKENRHVEAFDKINLKGMIDVYLSQGEKESVVVETDQNILPVIETEVKNRALIIKIKEGVHLKKVKKINVYVTFKNLTYLKSKGSGDAICQEDLNLKDLKVKSSGSGDVTLRGKISGIEIKNSGSGDIKAILKTQGLTIVNSGSGEVNLAGTASQGVITNSGSGDIKTSDFEVAIMNLKNYGSGDINLVGTASQSTITNSGSGDIKSSNFKVAIMNLKNYGSGDAYVNVTQQFSLESSGSGDITYTGNASINNISISGSGNITKK